MGRVRKKTEKEIKAEQRLVWDHNQMEWVRGGKVVDMEERDGSAEEIESAIKIELTNAVRALVKKGQSHMNQSNIYKHLTKKGFHKQVIGQAWSDHQEEVVAIVFSEDSQFLMELQGISKADIQSRHNVAKGVWPARPAVKKRKRTAESSQEAYIKQQLKQLLKTAKGAQKKKIEEKLKALNKDD